MKVRCESKQARCADCYHAYEHEYEASCQLECPYNKMDSCTEIKDT